MTISPTAVPFAITDPERIPSPRYHDAQFFALERERLWPFVWQMACRLEEIPEVGDWVEYRILDKSVIVVRTKSGVKAFHNACRHRGVQLASGQGNCRVQGFICPFHGWRWNAEGQNTFVYGRHMFSKRQLEADELALKPCRVDTWAGCAFINFDDEALPLRECLGPVTDRMDARHADRLKVEWWKSAILPVNWKLAMEAFMEGYHVMRTHPQLHALTAPETREYGPDMGSSPTASRATSGGDYVRIAIKHLANLSEGMAGMVHSSEAAIAESLADLPWPDDMGEAAKAFYGRLRDEITTDGRARGLPMPDLNEIALTHPGKAVEYMFPHYFLLPLFGAMSSYRIRPLTAETCLFEIWSLALFPEDEERPRPVAPEPLAHDDPSFPEIPRQDYSNLPRQQIGLHAQGFDYMRLSNRIEGMIGNYQRLIDGYIAGRDRAELARATQIVCSGFDAPVLDIGF